MMPLKEVGPLRLQCKQSPSSWNGTQVGKCQQMRMQHADSQNTAVELCDAAVACICSLVARQAQAQVAGDVHCGC